jgi:hypothetical protein
MITELETKRQRAAQQLGKLRQPLEAIDAAEQELADLDAQIAQQQAAEAERARQQLEHKNKVVGQQRIYARLNDPAYRDRMEIRDWARDTAVCRQRLVALGEPDPGDIVISAEATHAPIGDRAQRLADQQTAILTKDWATPEQVAANARRHELMSELMNSGRTQQDAEAIADLVVDDGLTLEAATARYDAAPELEDNDDDRND